MAAKTKPKTVRKQPDLLAAAGELQEHLARMGCEPTLVGGMALVTLGSPRVTRDFDFLVVEEAREHRKLIRVLYRYGLELVSRTDQHGNVVRTIDSQDVAFARLRIDRPKSAYFFNRETGLRVDLLFDFPIPAREVRRRSTRRTIQSCVFHIAGRRDLIRMKELAANARRLASDLSDLDFLRNL